MILVLDKLTSRLEEVKNSYNLLKNLYKPNPNQRAKQHCQHREEWQPPFQLNVTLPWAIGHKLMKLVKISSHKT